MSSVLFGRAGKLLLAAGLATALGCAPTTYSSYHGHYHHRGGSGAGLLVAGVIAGVAVASLAAEAERPPPRTAVYVYNSPPPPPVVYVPAPAPPPRADDLPPLDPAATRAAFGEVDLAGCNAPTVYGHAKITLNPDGHVSRVVVEDPADLDPAVAQCIGKKIGAVTTPQFRGGMVMLGITFRTP